MGAGLSAAELRAGRLGLGMTQRQLAAELGVTPTTLARWERGERAISNPVLVRLAAAMRRYWDMRGLPSEARDVLGALLDAASAEPTPARLYALIEIGGLAVSQEDATPSSGTRSPRHGSPPCSAITAAPRTHRSC